jgi:tetratricopeptide (TPR) repeat protein
MAVDAAVGRLMEAWPHPMEQTLIIVTSDHGEGLGEHGEWTHGQLLHQATLRVPFIFIPPAGVVVPENPNPALLVDVVPTIMAVLGLPGDESLDGRSLLHPPPARWTAWAETLYPYYQFQYSHLQAWFEDRRKLVDLGGRLEWYDLSTDPSELSDRRPTEPDVAAPLLEGLRYFRASRAPGKAIDVEVESSAAVPYMGGRPKGFPLEPSEERNRTLPSVRERLEVVRDLDAARAFLAKRPPEAWNAIPLLMAHEAELSTNPALSFWLARSLQHWGRSQQATEQVRLRKLEEAESRFREHQERFGDLRASDARIRTLWDRYQITGKRADALRVLSLADGERSAGVDRPLGRALSAQACEALGDREAAIAHLLEAARLDPEDPRFGQDLARLRAEQGSKR